MSPASGTGGSSATITGSFQVFTDLAEDVPVDVAQIWWLEPGNEQVLGEFIFTIDEQTLIASFGGNVTIPANASPA